MMANKMTAEYNMPGVLMLQQLLYDFS